MKVVAATVQQARSLRNLRTIAELTGGTRGLLEKGQVALDRVDALTRNGYLLGCGSSQAVWNGSYRKLVVKVNRPDVTVLHRHGYHREPEMGGYPFSMTFPAIRGTQKIRFPVYDFGSDLIGRVDTPIF
jgi:hypothetical protein